MRIALHIILLSLFSDFILIAQPAIQWQKSLGGTNQEYGGVVVPTSDGGYVISGTSNSNDGDVSSNRGGSDTWVAKLDMNGILEWETSLGGSSFEDYGYVVQCSDGGFIVGNGSQSIDGDVTDHHGADTTWDAWIVKLDSAGVIQWSKSYGGTSDDYVIAIQQTADGGFVAIGGTNSSDGDVVGWHFGTSQSINDMWIIKIDSVGNLQWQKCLGGSKNESGIRIRQTPDLGYIAGGTTSGSTDGDLIGNTDTAGFFPLSAWLVKLDSSGNMQWNRTYGGTGIDAVRDVMPTPDGGYILGCNTGSTDGDVTANPGFNSIWGVKVDSVGNIEWERCFGGTFLDQTGSIEIAPDGGYVFAGEAGSTDGDITSSNGGVESWIVKTDASGNIEWQRCYGGSSDERANHIALTPDSGYVFIGTSASNDFDVSGHHGFTSISDLWLVKLSSFTTSIDEYGVPVESLSIFPNPVTTSADISFYLKEAGPVTMEIFDMQGRIISTIIDERLSAGTHTLKWNGRDNADSKLADGLYVVKVGTSGYTTTGRIMVVN